MNYRFLLLLSVAVLLVVAGCSNKVPLRGTVTFDDGEPLTHGAVFFQSEKLSAHGVIQSDGTYTVGTDKTTDGIPRGTYQVFLAGTEHVEFRQTTTGMVDSVTGENIDHRFREEIRTPTIDPKYSSPATSGLTFTVDGRTRTFDIQVERVGR
jgi:hypothetical protein